MLLQVYCGWHPDDDGDEFDLPAVQAEACPVGSAWTLRPVHSLLRGRPPGHPSHTAGSPDTPHIPSGQDRETVV